MTNLEQSLAKLCAEHDLSTLSVSYFPKSERCHAFYSANAHGRDHHASGNSPDNLAEAIGKALHELAHKRSTPAPVALADEELRAAA